jgi:hypothetical protein
MGLEDVELVQSVEEAFEIEIPDRDMGKVRTPRELADYVERRLWERAATKKDSAWSRPEIEQVIEGLILTVCPKAVFDLDTDFREIFP